MRSMYLVFGSVERGESLDAFVDLGRDEVLRALLDVGGAYGELVEQVYDRADARFEV